MPATTPLDYSGVLFDLEINLFNGLAGHPPVRNVNPIDYPFIPDVLGSIENVIGSQSGDLIFGDHGDNRITGYLGDDTMKGLGGQDVFHFDLSDGANVGNDTIMDFEVGIDKISLGGGLHANLQRPQSSAGRRRTPCWTSAEECSSRCSSSTLRC